MEEKNVLDTKVDVMDSIRHEIGALNQLSHQANEHLETLRMRLRQIYWVGLTDEDVSDIVKGMPNPLDGFLKSWGWLTFAREVEKKLREKNVDLNQSVDETVESLLG